MSKKLITLTPLGAYYFGGEHSFPVGEKDENPLASYIIESNLFPQQTSLLGMLRFVVLNNAGESVFKNNRIQDSKLATTFIGATSFNAKNGTTADFGKIINLDFCFLQQQDGGSISNILPVPLDYQLEMTFGEDKAYCNGVQKTIPKIANYSSKNGLPDGYLNLQTKKILKEEDIFIRDQRIGINRDVISGKTQDNALFKQVRYQLQEGFRFAFIVQLAEGYQLPSSALVELGGDSSKFLLEVHEDSTLPCIEYAEELVRRNGQIHKLVLLSDSLIKNKDVDDDTIFAITSHVPFKFLSFGVETSDYKLSNENLKKSERFSLFAKRSVFYFANETQLNTFLHKINNPVFQQIGYNKYQISKK